MKWILLILVLVLIPFVTAAFLGTFQEDLTVGNNIYVAVMDYGGIGTGSYYTGNLNLVRIGN